MGLSFFITVQVKDGDEMRECRTADINSESIQRVWKPEVVPTQRASSLRPFEHLGKWWGVDSADVLKKRSNS